MNERPMNEQMDRYARGELTAVEARELAQASLEHEALFDELTDTAVANAAVLNVRAMKTRRVPLKPVFAAAIAACVVIGIALYAARAPKSAVVSPPVLLANAVSQSEVFRSGEPASREPRETGRIVAIENGEATIDVGSMDGLSKGAVLDGLIVTAVFRDHARARITGAVHTGDPVQVPAAGYLNALLNRADTIAKAQSAIDWARSHGIPPEVAASLATQSAGPAMMNNLGVLAEMGGDPKKAESIYAHALAFAQTPEDRQAIAANLARVRK